MCVEAMKRKYSDVPNFTENNMNSQNKQFRFPKQLPDRIVDQNGKEPFEQDAFSSRFTIER